MRRTTVLGLGVGFLLVGAFFAHDIGKALAQSAQGLTNAADPYANNAAPGSLSFPLAAKAGQDSKSFDSPPPGAINKGRFDAKTWVYGNRDKVAGQTVIWNPVKIKMMEGAKVTGGTLFSATDPETYCAMANSGYDFVWTEMQHNTRDWNQAARMWRVCPHARAVPGVRIAYADEREEQRALDAGALVLVVPTVRSYEEAIKARDFAYFPPLGRRSQGGGQAFDPAMWGNVPGGYRATINDNLVLILMIETPSGVADAERIAKIPGVTAIFAASGDLGNHGGYPMGSPDYERMINIVHDAAIKAGVRLCGPIAWRDRPDFTCFQGASELVNITKGAQQDLGPLGFTTGVPKGGPYAPGGDAYVAPKAPPGAVRR